MKLLRILLLLALATNAYAQPPDQSQVGPGQPQIASLGGLGATGVFSVYRAGGGTVTLSGTWAGTVTFEGTYNYVNYVSMQCTPIGGGAAVTTSTTNGTWSFLNSGWAAVRVRASAYASGVIIATVTTAPMASGGAIAGALTLTDGFASIPGLGFTAAPTTGIHRSASGMYLDWAGAAKVRVAAASTNFLSPISIGSTIDAPDVWIYRDAADTIAIRDAANAQTIFLYKTYTNSTNYERLKITSSNGSGYGEVATEALGTGTNRVLQLNGAAGLYLFGGSNSLLITNTNLLASDTIIAPSVVSEYFSGNAFAGVKIRNSAGAVPAFASLATCDASMAGTLAPVSDSTTIVWGATITGGGANFVMALCNGANWTVAAK